MHRVKSSEVNQQKILFTEEYISNEALAISSTKLIPPSTPLVAMYGATAGQVFFLEIEAAANQAVLAIVPMKDHPKILFYILSYMKGKYYI